MQVGSLTYKQIVGPIGVHRPVLAGSIKANESKHLARFAAEEIAYHLQHGRLRSQRAKDLCNAGRCLAKWWSMLDAMGREPSSAIEVEQCKACIVNHNCLMMRAGETLAPKHRKLYHIAQKIPLRGNPVFYSTYADESFNGVVVRLARSMRPTQLAAAVLRKYHVFCRVQTRFL